MGIEHPPYLAPTSLLQAMATNPQGQLKEVIDRVNDSFEYWSAVKYKQCPAGVTPVDLWTMVKAARAKTSISVWKRYGVTLSLTGRMQQLCHLFDVKWGAKSVAEADAKQQYMLSSLMEEAIASSQIEGAATTRKVAKEMLRMQIKPRDKSQRMICNNYQAINFIVEHKNEPLTEQLLLRIHSLMTAGTMANAQDSGRFRSSNEVVVENGITHEVVHTPPPCEEIPQFVDELCRFFNAPTDSGEFIHPVIRGIIIHFMVGYVHPFADGNGRTARALFYWYMVRQGYRLTEYLSISRIIARSKHAYERAYLYSEADSMEIGYFVTYHLNVIEQAFNQLQQYIARKEQQKAAALQLMRAGNINQRQAQIIQILMDEPTAVLTVKDLCVRLLVSPTTAKTDLAGLMQLGIVDEIALNKIKRGYIRSESFDRLTCSR